MSDKTILLLFVTFLFSVGEGQKKFSNGTRFKYRYPELYRDHIFDSLSEMGKEVFYAINIQPSCVAKKGQCIPRAHCVGKDMLYISRICYKRDLVCCYDRTIRYPEVADKYASTATDTNYHVNTTTTTELTTTTRNMSSTPV